MVAKRFEVRHNNDIYHVFDTRLYIVIDAYRDKQSADEHVDQLNGKK